MEMFLHYGEGVEGPTVFKKWVSIGTLASVLQRRVWLDMGHGRFIYPNHFIVLVGPSAARKSTNINLGASMLRNLPALRRRLLPDSLTIPVLFDQLERSHILVNQGDDRFVRFVAQSPVVSVASEIAVFLDETKGGGTLIPYLTDLYDCRQGPGEPYEKVTKMHGKVCAYSPCLNIIGGTTSEWLCRGLTADAIGGGFTSRIIFVVHDKPLETLYAFGDKRSDEIREKLVAELRDRIAHLHGPMELTPQAMRFFEAWYKDQYYNPPKCLLDKRFDGYRGRRHTSVLKVAMVKSASCREDLRIDVPELQWAIGELEAIEPGMPEAFGAKGLNMASPVMRDAWNAIRKRPDGITRGELLRLLWRDTDDRGLEPILTSLMSMGLVRQSVSSRGMLFQALTPEVVL